MEKTYLHPTAKKIFPLEDLSILPKNYARFLNDCVSSVISSILEYHKSETPEEALEKYKKQVRKLNPGKADEELFMLKDPLVSLYFKGQLKFSEPIKRKRKNIYREISRFEELVYEETQHYKGIPIAFDNNKKDISNYVNEFKKALDKKYPNRENKVQTQLFDYKYPRNIELNLCLRSFPTSCLEVNIALCDHGFTSSASLKDKKWYAIPGIKLEAKLLRGLLDFPNKIVNRLEKIVKRYYGPFEEGSGISNEIKYVEY